MSTDFTIDQFCTWLCDHEIDIVGEADRCFSSPLACFLSDLSHVTIGVDDVRYGRASLPWWQWKPLPLWATAFLHRLERYPFRSLTGLDALTILADVEYIVVRS